MSLFVNMITVQLNLYIFIYDSKDKDFNIISIDKNRLEIPSLLISDTDKTIRDHLDSVCKTVIIDYQPTYYRLLNNLILDSCYHSLYFCVIPTDTKFKEIAYKLPVKNYAIHSPNIQKIMQKIR